MTVEFRSGNPSIYFPQFCIWGSLMLDLIPVWSVEVFGVIELSISALSAGYFNDDALNLTSLIGIPSPPLFSNKTYAFDAFPVVLLQSSQKQWYHILLQATTFFALIIDVGAFS